MRSASFLAFLPLLACGCAAGGEESRSSRAEARLASELEGRVAGEAQACVPARQNQALTVRDKRTIVYRDGDTLWVNRLEAVCSSLDPFGSLIVEAHGSRYCRNDLVRGLESGSSIPGPWCRLGDFTPWRRR